MCWKDFTARQQMQYLWTSNPALLYSSSPWFGSWSAPIRYYHVKHFQKQCLTSTEIIFCPKSSNGAKPHLYTHSAAIQNQTMYILVKQTYVKSIRQRHVNQSQYHVNKSIIYNASQRIQMEHLNSVLKLKCPNTGIILCMGSANQRRRYTVTPSLIGWAHECSLQR